MVELNMNNFLWIDCEYLITPLGVPFCMLKDTFCSKNKCTMGNDNK